MDSRYYQLTFTGRADHSGTTPMDQRLDALQGASSFILAANKLVKEDFPSSTINIGSIQVNPGALTVVPGEVMLILGMYAEGKQALQSLEDALLEEAQHGAAQLGLKIEIDSHS
jgi:acetylornithine deacetylase/succinyl-diaminopimelate desuccinylase-like protein